MTTRRLIILPAYQTVRPSPHDLAGPLSVSLAGVGCFDDQCEVVVLSPMEVVSDGMRVELPEEFTVGAGKTVEAPIGGPGAPRGGGA